MRDDDMHLSTTTALAQQQALDLETLEESERKYKARKMWNTVRVRFFPGRPEHRHARVTGMLGFLFVGYSPKVWWWEAVVLGRKVCFVLVSVFFATNTAQQILLMTMLATISRAVEKNYPAWEDERFNSLEEWSSGFLLMAMFSTLMLYQEGSTPVIYTAASFAVLLSLWGFVAIFVYHSYQTVKSDIKAATHRLSLSFSQQPGIQFATHEFDAAECEMSQVDVSTVEPELQPKTEALEP